MFLPRGRVHRFTDLGILPATMLLVYTPGGVEEGCVEEGFVEAGIDAADPAAEPWAPDAARGESGRLR